MTLNHAGLFSYLMAALAFLLLTLLLIVSWRGRPLGRMAILASAVTAIWAIVLLFYQSQELHISVHLVWFAEFTRNASWCVFLLKVGGQTVMNGAGKEEKSGSVWQYLFGMLLITAFLAVFVFPVLAAKLGINPAHVADLSLLAWVAVPIGGMLLVEQIYRSAGPTERWILRYLCLGVGAIFAYDFFLYSDALLFKGVNKQLWQARGIVNSLSVPLIAISIARNPIYDIAIHVSRSVVFNSVTVLGAGCYLLAMAGVGYVIRFYGGTWGGVLQTFFFCGAIIFLVTIIFSDKIRAKARVFLAKHFYSFKYDYRAEWLKFTESLAETEDPVPERVIRSIAALVSSEAGLIWRKGVDGRYFLLSRWRMAEPENMHLDNLNSLSNFLEKHRWVVDLDEYHEYPAHYEGLNLPLWLTGIPKARLIVPLVFKQEVQAFVVLKRSEVRVEINWEDRDLLKMAGQQAAIYLAQYLADKELVEVRQFDAFNRLSAYIVHDLKNILAQQSLIVVNAEKHRYKPEFVDDVIRTVENSVSRMTRLMEQLRSGIRGGDMVDVDIAELLKAVVIKRSAMQPNPVVKPSTPLIVHADREQLANVFGHIIQNAQEATPKSGTVEVTCSEKDDRIIVSVSDTGRGMDENFIRDRLFKPFESTKGLTGMGIGLFESREYIRVLGGDILVTSSLVNGTVFQIVLPSARPCNKMAGISSLEEI